MTPLTPRRPRAQPRPPLRIAGPTREGRLRPITGVSGPGSPAESLSLPVIEEFCSPHQGEAGPWRGGATGVAVGVRGLTGPWAPAVTPVRSSANPNTHQGFPIHLPRPPAGAFPQRGVTSVCYGHSRARSSPSMASPSIDCPVSLTGEVVSGPIPRERAAKCITRSVMLSSGERCPATRSTRRSAAAPRSSVDRSSKAGWAGGPEPRKRRHRRSLAE